MPDQQIHDFDFNRDTIPGEDRRIYTVFRTLSRAAFKTIRSECIVVDDDEITEVLCREFGTEIADFHADPPSPEARRSSSAWSRR